MNSLVSLPIAYLLGSIPTAVWTARIWKGIDIREYGSKNAGLTNVFRVLGWKPALPVVIVDLCKGMLGPWIALKIAPDQPVIALLAGILTILGHSFTCLAGFRGGKGVLTSMGVFLTLSPVASLLAFSVWVLVTFTSGFVSLGSILACITLALLLLSGFLQWPVIGPWVGEVHPGLLATGVATAAFVVYKHKANMVRLWNGTENRFGKRGKKQVTV